MRDHPWLRFLIAREHVILWLLSEGKTHTEIAATLSIDPAQVALIAQGASHISHATNS